jgi:ferredoxin--NADP+ reductase
MVRRMSGRYVIAVIGGATAGAEAAGMLAEHGVTVVVFEQNARPYGKIEDGLPRWHVKLRQKEYETVNHRLDRPEVHFVPLTKIGRDIDFRALVTEWGSPPSSSRSEPGATGRFRWRARTGTSAVA